MEPTSSGARGDLAGGGEQGLHFTRRFLPESLALTEPLTFLSPVESLTLNQIRGHAYLGLLELVEGVFLPRVLDRAIALNPGDELALGALRRVVDEKANHVQLFRRFRDHFCRGFGSPCEVVGSTAGLGRTLAAPHPLAAALAVLHVESTAARHQSAGRDDEGLEPQWRRLLELHGTEEAWHSRRDTTLVTVLAESCSALEVGRGVEQFLSLVGLLECTLEEQVHLDLESLVRAAGRELSEGEREAFQTVQRRANLWTFLGSGLTHASFLSTLGGLGPAAREHVERAAASFR